MINIPKRLNLNPASLRIRLSVWYVVFTFVCMGCYGALLLRYLQHELRSSREETMRRREHRLLIFVDEEARLRPESTLEQRMSHFMEAAPETDLIAIRSPEGKLLYPSVDPELPLPPGGPGCREQPCLSLVWIHSHPMRVLTQQIQLAGRPVWLILAGQADEHFEILSSVRTGYFLLLPFVLLGSVAGGYALSRRALLPVGRLTEKARTLSMTALDGRLPVPQTGDELQALAEAWNDLLMRLEAEVNRSTQFTMDASHDLRTAVTVILANAQLSLRRTRSADQYQETMTTIVQEATCILGMLEEMLLAARSGDAQQQVTKEWMSFSDIVLEVFEASRANAVMKQLKVGLLACDDIWLLGDRALLRRMVSTLVDNALKYTPAGGEVTLSLEQESRRTVFLVRDNGIGIAPALHTRIFDRLFRADFARSRVESRGNGLGLSIAKWIAEVHGFTIELESAVGRGSTFTVLMPNAREVSPLNPHRPQLSQTDRVLPA
jgi:two-component system heavy metal sensor histidine kinase CusS